VSPREEIQRHALHSMTPTSSNSEFVHSKESTRLLQTWEYSVSTLEVGRGRTCCRYANGPDDQVARVLFV
jgi:hypothetical protein